MMSNPPTQKKMTTANSTGGDSTVPQSAIQTAIGDSIRAALSTAAAPLFALMGSRALLRLVLRACVQAGHLWALFGQSYEEYGPSSRPQVPAEGFE